MIEVVYKDEKREVQKNEGNFNLPRNIRQIGQIRGNYRIYMEDYVYTFLGRLFAAACKDEEKKGSLAVFTGEMQWEDGTGYLFIRGALLAKCQDLTPEHIDLSEEVWITIQDEQKQYFPEQHILGWYFAFPQMAVEITELMQKIHLQYFGGEKVLMLAEPTEGEEAFFHYENGLMAKVKGYYIYYEKNAAMQEYMVQKNQILKPEFTEKCSDEAVTTFRKIIQEKKNKSNEAETEVHTSVFSYAATACILLALLAVGTGLYRNYREFQDIKENVPSSSMAVGTDVKKREDAENVNAESTSTESTSTESTNTEGSNTEGVNTERKNAESANAESTNTEIVNTENVNTESTNTENVNPQNQDEDSWEEVPVTEKPQESRTENSSDENAVEETGSSEFYRQESDERKAKRREALTKTTAEDSTGADIRSDMANSAIEESDIENAVAGNTEIKNEDIENAEDPSTAGVDTGTTEGKMAETSGNAHDTYVIRPGDTLYQISIEKYGSMDVIREICELNGIAENQIIYPGQVIVLP